MRYAGSNIRIRFHFNTVDNTLNTGDGWYVDNIQVDRSGPAAGCNEPSPNNSISGSTKISTGVQQSSVIFVHPVMWIITNLLPQPGNHLTMDIDAKSIGSALDPYLYLIDRNGKTVLAENDDEVASENEGFPHLLYKYLQMELIT